MNLSAHEGKLTTDTLDYQALFYPIAILLLWCCLAAYRKAVIEANTGTWSLDQSEKVNQELYCMKHSTKDQDVTELSLTEFEKSFLPIIDEAMKTHADRVCLQFEGEQYFYRDVDTLSAKVANALIKAGFKTGMKGAIYSLNSAIAFIVALGILRAGGTWIPVNPRNSEDENAALLEKLGCDVFFFQQTFERVIRQLTKKGIGNYATVCLDSPTDPYTTTIESFVQNVSSVAPNVSISPADLITIPTTGGTTGLPKGVMLSHRNFRALEYATRSRHQDQPPVLLCAAPMTHVGGRIALASLSSGARCVILDRVDPRKILKTIEQERITDFFLPPTGIYALLDQPNINDVDLSSLRSVSYGSAPMSINRLKEAIRKIGPVMRGGFGQTECPMFIASMPPEAHFVNGDTSGALVSDHRLTSVGKSTIISTLAILNESGEELPNGEKGEIAVKGPMVSEGYYKDPEATANVRINGWHLTGDIGYLDDEGYLYIVDRKKDMIITGGFNVYSAEVERALTSIPGVSLAVVIGVPSEKWGEEVKALIRLEEGSSQTDQSIMAAAKELLGSVKAPKTIEFVDEVPRTSVGKIDKKRIRSRYWEGLDRTI